jgi:hypothetical protein
MPGMVLEQILNRVKEADLREFKEKLLTQEKAMEDRLKAQGLKNMSMLIEEAKSRMSGTYLDYSDMGKETNIDGEAVLMGPGEATTAQPTDKPTEPKSGKEMFDAFLEKLK